MIMALAQGQSLKSSYYLFALKSFLVWTFTLTVCMIVVGFPVFALVVSVGALMAVTLHAILPISAVLLIAVSFIAIHAIGIMLAAAYLTLQGVHPQEVEWLRWLNGQANPSHTSVYAACPLTCELKS
jgi:type III secretory pathway component EscU